MRQQVSKSGVTLGASGPGRLNSSGNSLLIEKAIEPYSQALLSCGRPDVGLRFINQMRASLEARKGRSWGWLRLVPRFLRSRLSAFFLTAEYHRSIQQEFRIYEAAIPALSQSLNGVKIPLSASIYCRFYRTRHFLYGMGIVAAGLLIFITYSLATWSARKVNEYLTQKYQRYRAPIVVSLEGRSGAAASVSTGFAGTGAKYLPDYKPEKVWQVEASSEFERYSNGARILRRYETDNRPRGYYLIPRGGETAAGTIRRDAVGIVYHTSESDIVPFISENSQSIAYRSKGLLEYVRRHKSYNYLIDRYGEIFRIVRDDHTAFHAGHSIWGDDRYSYVGLNESFLGICFESTSTAGTLEETLTEAQIVSGRALTNVLRSRFNIEDVNCTTHGLVSINPHKMVVAYHYDWVRNFPFEAMGLSDKYKIPPPNILDYGCIYDDETLEKLKNTLWSGAIKAEEEFRLRVDRSRMSSEALRSKLRDRYHAQLNQARQQNSSEGEQSGEQSARLSTAER
ncbi:MAG: N-acetylmuramoyl-L-alanine amidase [Acidobacteria bacterium]|nr:N-acetylmuramoyl-L-alanine amidase [Acidobacteriota bacterium]